MSLKAKFNSQYAKFLVALPMNDPIFIAGLIAGEILPGDTKDEIRAKATNVQKAEVFLEKCIAPSFSDDGTENLMLQKLLKIMLDSDYVHVKELAKELIKDDGNDTPNMRDLRSNIVSQYAAQWESLGLELGLKGYDIANISENNANHPRKAEECCVAVLEQWLKEMPSPTWSVLNEALKNIKLSSTTSHDKEVTPGKIPSASSLSSKPSYWELEYKFKEVTDWESICAYLINDDTGQRTMAIKRNNTDVDGRRSEMLGMFLQEPEPTWEKVIAALRAGRYNNLADSIKKELQVETSQELQQETKNYKSSENEKEMQKALSLALKDGVASSSSVTIYILGQEKAGKTCLVASLLGNKFEEQNATHGANVDVCKVFASKWSYMEKTKVPKKLKGLYHSKLKVTAQIKMSTEQLQPALQAKDKQELLDNLPELPEAVQADLKQAKSAILIDEDGINAVIWDFAGQSVYHGLHSMFLKEDSVVMIVFDASQPLQDPVKGRDTYPYTQKCINPVTTGCESVRYWLQSIHSIRKDGTQLGATSLFVPTIFLVATHVDLIGDAIAVGKKKIEIIEQLILIFKDQSFANHIPGAEDDLREALMKNCFFISNKVRNEKELGRLKDALVQATKYILNKKHPVVYLNIEQNVLTVNKAAITRDELHHIAQNSGFFAKPESPEFKGAVEHFHRKGTILHFPQTKTLKDVVVVSPDWLTKLFSYVIIAHPYRLECNYSLQSERLIKFGILEEKFISFMVNKFNKDQEKFGLSLSTEQAIEFAQMFGFIAEVNSTTRFLEESHQLSRSDERVFIVPAMLPFDLPSNIKLPDDKNLDARIIYFKFSEEFIPKMVFYQMLGACISRNIEKEDPLHCIRRHMIKMVLGRDQIYYVTLSETHHSIKLAIVPDNIKSALSSQSLQERWELIEEFNDKLIEKVEAFMPASDPPQRYIPCCLCSKLHLNLNEIRANDRPLHCFNGRLPEDYYIDLRQYKGVHQFNEAKLTDNFDCSTAQKNIRENYDEMTHLPINSILNKLYSKGVITLEQKQQIKAYNAVEAERMEYFLDNIIIPSLQCDDIRKFKGLFEIMKDSGDSTLTATAEKISNH